MRAAKEVARGREILMDERSTQDGPRQADWSEYRNTMNNRIQLRAQQHCAASTLGSDDRSFFWPLIAPPFLSYWSIDTMTFQVSPARLSIVFLDFNESIAFLDWVKRTRYNNGHWVRVCGSG